MPHCPAGHGPAPSDRCGVCGVGAVEPAEVAAPAEEGTPPARPPCPECGLVRFGRFCEACGYDFTTGTPHPRTRGPGARGGGWVAVVDTDLDQYRSMVERGLLDSEAVPFPSHARQHRTVLHGWQVTIGRGGVAPGGALGIDLDACSGDPAVSHAHAALLARADGSWAVADLGSTNGTTLNGDTVPLASGTEVSLRSEDRLRMGAWTVITVRHETGRDG
ncbi:FHA domain-containing protein [Haloactinospora alba]|uniref:FHA domain-containing protein n=2 Tax=Haloactinospora alba TaxID=405555 RepID=A0A543NN58_9ACTN|nr:FHA domain-containing protein [Haloactinospora alba]